VALPAWKFPSRARIRAAASATTSEDRESFYHSIRFRLTAWYAIVLIIVIVTLGFALSTSVSRALQEESDSRLFDSADEIYHRTELVPGVEGIPSNEVNPRDPVTKYILSPPDIDEFVLSGLWVQFLNPDGSKAEFVSRGATTAGSANVIFPPAIVDKVDTSDVLATGVASFQTIKAEELVARVLVYPITVGPDNDIVVGALIVGLSRETQADTISVVNRNLILGGILGVFGAAMAGWLVAGRALAPVKRITSAAENIALHPNSADLLATRIDVPKSGDELSHLASTFNTMLARIEDAFAVQRRFVADASHELRTPLTAIRGNVDVLLRQATSDRPLGNDILIESLDDVHRESGRMGRLIDDLLTLARDDTRGVSDGLQRSEVSLDELAREVFETLEPLAGDRVFVLDANDSVTVLGDADRLTQVMLILGENALRHTPASGTVSISVERATEDDDKPCSRITVRDSGEGISEEHLPHIFERFYRASGARERGSGGTGLGLSIALGIVRAHGGWIDVETAPGRGSAFTVSIPMSQ
jgi:signal transduction histidine kinase